MTRRFLPIALLTFAATGFVCEAQAASIVSTVGAPPPGCSTTNGCATGTDLSGTLTGGYISSDFSWTHSFGAITDTILSATLTLDIIDADGGFLDTYVNNMSGDFVGVFDPVGNNSGGSPGPWRVPGDPLDPVMSISLSSSLFAELMDGTVSFFGDNRGLGIWGINSAILTIETSGGNSSTVPLPAGLPLLIAGVGGLGACQLCRRKQQA